MMNDLLMFMSYDVPFGLQSVTLVRINLTVTDY